MTDELLATTRAVRKRLDLDRPVPREVILECLELAVQAPTGSNSQGWRWIVVDDPDLKKKIADCYRAGGDGYLEEGLKIVEASGHKQTQRVMTSAMWLVENLERVPVFLIPCIKDPPTPDSPPALVAGQWGSIFPAVWSFQLALRARGLGSTITTLHLNKEKEVAELLGIPDDVGQVALLPVGYTKGTDFKRAERGPVERITHWNGW
jgi:nitroreductase